MKVYKHSQYSYVTIAEIPREEIDRIDIDICAQPTETLYKYYNRQTRKPTILTNAGFFNMKNGETIFTLINDGGIVSHNTNVETGIGIIDSSTLGYGKMQDYCWRDFICGYPCLLHNGIKQDTSIANSLNYNARRTMVGYNNKALFIVCVDSPGLNFTKMINLMLSLGCEEAINLDGGGSSKMLYNGKPANNDNTNRPVDSVLAVYLKEKPEAKVIYRVQAGAFRSEANAANLKYQINGLEDKIGAGYAKAYVRKVDGLYKTQIGAFSKKENAEKVVKDLKSKGINAFITTK